jgi:hypothetical protein
VAGALHACCPPQHIPKDDLSVPLLGSFLCAGSAGTDCLPSGLIRCVARETEMAHWRKRNPPASRFNAHLIRWAFAFSIVLGTLALLSLRGHV